MRHTHTHALTRKMAGNYGKVKTLISAICLMGVMWRVCISTGKYIHVCVCKYIYICTQKGFVLLERRNKYLEPQ